MRAGGNPRLFIISKEARKRSAALMAAPLFLMHNQICIFTQIIILVYFVLFVCLPGTGLCLGKLIMSDVWPQVGPAGALAQKITVLDPHLTPLFHQLPVGVRRPVFDTYSPRPETSYASHRRHPLRSFLPGATHSKQKCSQPRQP